MKVILKKKPLYESFDFDSDEDEYFDVIIEFTSHKKFLEDNYDINNTQVKPYKKDGMLFIDVDGDVMVKNEELTSLTNGRFYFGKVKGGFYCDDCTFLKTLEGAPEKVEGKFDCSYCKSLTSLEGAPREVGGDFYCWDCSLKTLEGAPEKVGGKFDCSYCKSLTSLEGAPREVGGSFNCTDCKSLTSLKGFPEKVRRNFSCYRCNSLETIDLPTTSKIKGKIFR